MMLPASLPPHGPVPDADDDAPQRGTVVVKWSSPVAASVEWEIDGRSLTVRFAGELCMWSVRQISPLVARIVDAERPAYVRVDLAAVEFIDGRGVTMLIEMRRAVAEVGGTSSVVEASALVRRLLALSGLDGIIDPASAR